MVDLLPVALPADAFEAAQSVPEGFPRLDCCEGEVAAAADASPFAHLGWAISKRADFLRAARQFITNAILARHQVHYIGDGRAADLRAELEMPVAAAGRFGTRIDVVRLEDFFAVAHGRVVPRASESSVVSACSAATAAGFRGMTIVVDATALALTDSACEALGEFEVLLDRKIHQLPLAAMCAYDVQRVPAATDLLCEHPLVRSGSVPFQLSWRTEIDLRPGRKTAIDLRLSGEVGFGCLNAFAVSSRRVLPLTPDAIVGIDTTELNSIDRHGLYALDQAASATNRWLVLHNSSPAIGRLACTLELAHIEVRA